MAAPNSSSAAAKKLKAGALKATSEQPQEGSKKESRFRDEDGDEAASETAGNSISTDTGQKVKKKSPKKANTAQTEPSIDSKAGKDKQRPSRDGTESPKSS